MPIDEVLVAATNDNLQASTTAPEAELWHCLQRLVPRDEPLHVTADLPGNRDVLLVFITWRPVLWVVIVPSN
jgi:hypothetical protein